MSPNDVEMSRPRARRDDTLPEDTEYKPINWRKIFLSPKYIPFHIIGLVILVLTIIISIRHDAVVKALKPFSEKVRDIPAGFLIFVAVLFIISFPPLFGHEIIAPLCGIVYGLWIGFAIVAAGTFLGEVGNWFAFRYLLRRRAAKLERTNLNFGALARLVREGGFLIILIIRLSAIPAHFSTAVFSTCDVKFWLFCVATILSLPKQIFLVYLGVLLVQQKSSNFTKFAIFGAIFVVTIVMAVYIYTKLRGIKKDLLEEQAARRAKRDREQAESEWSFVNVSANGSFPKDYS